METILAFIRYRGVSIEMLVTLLLVVFALYLVFRWRKFGEDSFTWNHEYFQRAWMIGLGLWVAISSIGFLPDSWHIWVWLTGFVVAVLALSYWGSEGLNDAVILAALIVGVGVAALPVPGLIRHALFSVLQGGSEDILAGVPRRTFALHLPEGWKELPGKSPRTYTRRDDGSGFLQLSFQPPLEKGAVTEADAENELSGLLDSLEKSMGLGKRLSVSHQKCASGVLAFADYQSEEHGPIRFWLMPSEVTIFASYTDGKPGAAQREIAEAHQTLLAAKFE